MSRDYFYFISGLPNLNFEDSKLGMTAEQFREDAARQLSEADFHLLNILHLPQDLDNLLKVLYKTGSEQNPEGLFTEAFWEGYLSFLRTSLENPNSSAVSEYSQVPDFVAPIMKRILQQEEIPSKDQTEHELISGLYTWAMQHSNEFISKWFAHEATIRNILMAISGRKYEMPYARYLVGDDETVEKLAKSHAADFGLGKEHELYEALIRIYEQNNILYRERNYDILRWKWIDNQNFFMYFNIDRLLGYYCKLRILTRWLHADPDHGKEIFHDVLDALENSFSFPEEFNIKSSIKH